MTKAEYRIYRDEMRIKDVAWRLEEIAYKERVGRADAKLREAMRVEDELREESARVFALLEFEHKQEVDALRAELADVRGNVENVQ